MQMQTWWNSDNYEVAVENYAAEIDEMQGTTTTRTITSAVYARMQNGCAWSQRGEQILWGPAKLRRYVSSSSSPEPYCGDILLSDDIDQWSAHATILS